MNHATAILEDPKQSPHAVAHQLQAAFQKLLSGDPAPD